MAEMREQSTIRKSCTISLLIGFAGLLAACLPLVGHSGGSSAASNAELPQRLQLRPGGGVFLLDEFAGEISIEVVNTGHQPEAIYYTTDNEPPTTQSSVYTEPFTVEKKTQFIRAKAVFAEETGEPDAFAAGLYVVVDKKFVTPYGNESKQQWHYDTINMPKAWTILSDALLSDGFEGSRVAVLDTGYWPHEDLIPNLIENTSCDGYGWYFVTDPFGDYTDGCDAEQAVDGNAIPHGTHVSGTIAGALNDNGYVGIGWDAHSQAGNAHSILEMMPVRVLRWDDSRWIGRSEDVAEGIKYAAGLDNRSETTPDMPVHVINLSLGGDGYDPILKAAIQSAVDKGITVVASAGNSDKGNDVVYPARFDNTIAVSATNKDNERAVYSSFGPEVDFAAPGGEGSSVDASGNNGNPAPDAVWSTWRDNEYAGLQGTSMAAPHVSAVVGLLYAYEPNLNQSDVYEILKRSANPLGSDGRTHEFGWGLIDAEAALRTLLAHKDAEGWGSGTRTTSLRSRSPAPARPRSSEIDWENAEYEPHTLLVRLRDGARGAAADHRREQASNELARAHGLSVRRILGQIAVVRVPVKRSLHEVAEALLRDPAVEHVQPNYVYRAMR